MDKKSFYLSLIVIALTLVMTLFIKFYRPATAGDVNFDTFPLQIGDWQGTLEELDPQVLELLNPQAIISATYVNSEGVSIHLLFDFFSSEATFGGPHSPRNCLPGAGWVITETIANDIQTKNSVIPAGRFQLKLNNSKQVMDFWYITHYGETANDYVFKLYELLSALTFKPRDIAFVRFVGQDDPKSLKALEEFQTLILEEIYGHLPFEK